MLKRRPQEIDPVYSPSPLPLICIIPSIGCPSSKWRIVPVQTQTPNADAVEGVGFRFAGIEAVFCPDTSLPSSDPGGNVTVLFLVPDALPADVGGEFTRLRQW